MNENKASTKGSTEKLNGDDQREKRLEKIITIYLIVLILLVWLVPYDWIEKLSIWMNHKEIERRLPPELREKFGPFGLEEGAESIFKETSGEGLPAGAPTPVPAD